MEIEGIKIVGEQFSAILDDETCDFCEAHDGQIAEVGQIIAFPVHPDCRCIKIYIGEDEIDINRAYDYVPPTEEELAELTFKERNPKFFPKFGKSPGGRDVLDIDSDEWWEVGQ